ncbi:hypothetical protein M9Y10_036360 [Tritrichomonas musculus]|uniref:CYRIA/CYRIB Rac1 binding domain-containing protein n=1 Tax=Tritrichomonas musculus TaxID=1915356 RepID=A0ABR2GW70_9EUKA
MQTQTANQHKNPAYCEDLQSVQLVEVAPKSVPQAIFVRYPNETCFDHSLYEKSGLPAVSNINDIHMLENDQKQIEELTSNFYARRSIYRPIEKYMKSLSPDVIQQQGTALVQIAKAQSKPLIDLINTTIESVDKSVNDLRSILTKSEQWNTGAYSEELLFNICKLIYLLFVLDQIHMKQSIKIDVDGFNKLAQNSILTQPINQFINDKELIEKKLLEKLALPTESLTFITSIFYRYIKESLKNNQSLYSNYKYVLLISLAFFIKLCPAGFPTTEFDYLKGLYEECPYVPLYHEFSMNILSHIQNLNYFKGKGATFVSKLPDPTREIKSLRTRFSDVSTKLHYELLTPRDENDSNANLSITTAVQDAIQLILYTTNMLREQYAAKIDKNPYETAVREGYSQLELRAAIQLLTLCRELNDLIRMNKPAIFPRVCTFMQSTFQEFVKNILEKTVVRAKRKKKSIKNIIDGIRSIAGDYSTNESSVITAKKSAELKGKKHEIKSRVSPPSPQLLEIIRVQVQQMITPEAKFLQPSKKILKSKHAFHETDEKRLQTFVADSTNWISLIAFEQTLSDAADQSCFYFKEMHLDLNNAVQFPVKSSLPFILCQYALDNYVQPELTEIIFYPLSIYDDAANIAISTHHSRLMFDEIKAEAKVALDTLSNLIGEFTYNAFRTFATLRQLPDKVVSHLKKNHHHHWPNSRAYRLRTLLQQNQYYLLSKQIALKSLIAPRVDSELNNSVAQIYQVAKDLGITASLAISRVLNIIKETHRLLTEQGLSLMPFKDIEKAAKWDSLPESFSSKYLSDISNHLIKNVVRYYALAINPLRLIPPKKLQLPAEPLGKLTLGRLLKDALDSTVSFVTIHHFSVFLRSISDGAVVLLAQELRDTLLKVFNSFIDRYRVVSSRLTRIKDAPFGSSAHAAFTRYESAYKFFLSDEEISRLLRDMQTIGNILIVSELIDEALTMKEFNVVQVMSYLRSVDENNNPRDEIERLFTDEFKEAIKVIISRPMSIAEDSHHLMMRIAINTLGMNIIKEMSTFEEPNRKSLEFTQMSGFACCWSVLEFVYGLAESMRVADSSSGFAKHGQGVQICAAVFLLITGQTDLNQLLCIGKKMVRHLENDMSGMADEKTLRYLAVCQYETAAVDWAMLFFQPFVDNFRNNL